MSKIKMYTEQIRYEDGDKIHPSSMATLKMIDAENDRFQAKNEKLKSLLREAVEMMESCIDGWRMLRQSERPPTGMIRVTEKITEALEARE